jgi:hypothetical protein
MLQHTHTGKYGRHYVHQKLFKNMSIKYLVVKYTGCLKKNGPRYNFAIDDPNEKNYTENEMALKTLQSI